MCGIIGYLDKRGGHEHAVGQVMLSMLQALSCRGPDSAGVALFGSPRPGWVVQLKLPEHPDADEATGAALHALDAVATDVQHQRLGAYLRLEMWSSAAPSELEELLLRRLPDAEVVSFGHQLEIVKQVGSPANLEKTYGISRARGTHGLGHTRLSTESRVDLSHSQPFWSHGHPDVAIVHNGHITNYHQLRRRYQQRGVRFYTENDSEVVAIYLGDQLGRGRSLEEALQAMLRELDGSYSCLAATGTHLGYVKDRFALKPLLWAETDGFVAVANEEVAMRSALPGAYPVQEAQAEEVRVWAR